jgi:cbb3-type cytochrome oxidase maturation protein
VTTDLASSSVLLLALTIPWWVLVFLVCRVLGLAAWMVFLWGVRTGQFREAERTAAEMMENEARETAPSPPPTGRPERAGQR